MPTKSLKYFWIFFQKQYIKNKAKAKIGTHLKQFYHSKNLATKVYTSKIYNQETLRL